MKIFLGADHRGYNLKEKIKDWLSAWGYQHEDFGAYKLNPKDDYPNFVSQVAEKISQKPKSYRGIVLGASGQGEAIVANRYKKVRAVVYYGGTQKIIELSRQHNDANILSLGASFLDEDTTKKIIKLWLETKFSQNPRHIRRLNKIKKIEDNLKK